MSSNEVKQGGAQRPSEGEAARGRSAEGGPDSAGRRSRRGNRRGRPRRRGGPRPQEAAAAGTGGAQEQTASRPGSDESSQGSVDGAPKRRPRRRRRNPDRAAATSAEQTPQRPRRSPQSVRSASQSGRSDQTEHQTTTEDNQSATGQRPRRRRRRRPSTTHPPSTTRRRETTEPRDSRISLGDQSAGGAVPPIEPGAKRQTGTQHTLLSNLEFPAEDAWGDPNETTKDEKEQSAERKAAERTEADGATRQHGQTTRTDRPSPLSYASTDEIDPDAYLDVCLQEQPTTGTLFNVVNVQFGTAKNKAIFDAGDLVIRRGTKLIVSKDRGHSVGIATTDSRRQVFERTLPKVVRPLDHKDDSVLERNASREISVFQCCRQRINERNLPMKLVQTECAHGSNRTLFYFSAESRVDFRDLVRDLAKQVRSRIEMRQIGVRDESKVTGGIGPCGQALCCSCWINNFAPVSIRMAKDQNLVLNPSKVSGMCGRLKCCLAYEQQLYQEARRRLPHIGKQVQTPEGTATVQEIDIPRGLVRVSLSDGKFATFEASQVRAATQSRQPKQQNSDKIEPNTEQSS